jgi:hypothetical protein
MYRIQSPGGGASGTGSAGGQAPTKQASWERAWVLKLRGLSKMSLLGLTGALSGVPEGCSPRKWPNPVGAKTLGGSLEPPES